MVKLKILQVRLQQYVNWELPDAQAEFRKGRGTRDQIVNICWIIKKKQEHSRKISSLVSLTALRALILWVTTSFGKYLKRWKFQTTLPASWETCMQVKKQQLELDMEQWSGSNLGKEYVKDCMLSPCLFNFYAECIMRNLGWMTHKLNSRLPGKHQQIQICRGYHSNGRKQRAMIVKKEKKKKTSWGWKWRVNNLA